MDYHNKKNTGHTRKTTSEEFLFNHSFGILKSLLNSKNDIILITNHDAEVFFSNEYADKAIGSYDEIALFVKKNLFPTLSNNHEVELTLQNTTANQQVILWKKNVLIAENQQKYLLLIGTDISSIRELKNKLYTLDYIIKKVPGFVFWKDTELRNAGSNENFAQQVGFNNPDEVVGKTDYELPWRVEQTEQFLKDDKEVMDTGMPKLNFEETQRQLNGQDAVLLTSKVPLYSKEGKISGILGIYIDITKQKEMEKLKHQLEGAKLISASIAHEIRTPLATIKAGICFIRDLVSELINQEKLTTIPDNDIAELKECIALIDKKTDQSNVIINMLLTKLSGVHFDFTEFDSCSSDQCVTEALEKFVMPNSMENNIKYDSTNHFTFFGSNQLVMHIIMNLLKNAVFYIQKAGKGDISLWFEQKNSINEIHFRDTGPGIEKQVLKNIFKPFFTTEQSTGTGVGLAFCKMVMESHKGTIECFSELGQYTEFVLSFPPIGERIDQ